MEQPVREFKRGHAVCFGCEHEGPDAAARRLWREAQAIVRHSPQPLALDIDQGWLLAKLHRGVCDVTGRPFDYRRRAWQPVLLRRSPRFGFSERNTRLVVAAYADLLERWGPEDLVELAGFL